MFTSLLLAVSMAFVPMGVPADTGFVKLRITSHATKACYMDITVNGSHKSFVRAANAANKDTTFVFASLTGADTAKVVDLAWFVAYGDSVGRGLRDSSGTQVYRAPTLGKGQVTNFSSLGLTRTLSRTDTLVVPCTVSH